MIILVDLDETLLKTSGMYADARFRAAQLIRKSLGLDIITPLEIAESINRLDIIRAKTSRYGKDRFLSSILMTYAHYLGVRGCDLYDPCVEMTLLEIGESAFRVPPVYPDTVKFLSEIHGRDNILILYTCGDKEIQEKKLKAYPWITGHFSRVEIVDHKDTESMEAVVNRSIESAYRYSGKTVVMVGDSVALDIMPAWKLGYIPIHIKRHEGWVGFDHNTQIPPCDYIECDNLIQAIEPIIRLEREEVDV